MKLSDYGFKYFVLCGDCCQKVEDDIGGFALALFGPQGLDDDGAILAVVPWEQRWGPIADWCVKHHCDGCMIDVSVAPSSMWFIEKWREERDGSS